ncbi:MAG: SUMF1/EgtB/PvdO family nonheme iron enzyme [Myxococcales bacterium]|nr:SUMF1/EgtB/PvdO family nonheme iron enzyme [Myxococcales bacterium]
MLCHRCGSHVPDNAKTCNNCGATLQNIRATNPGTLVLRRKKRQQTRGDLPYRVGSTIADRYEVEELLGSGALGAVYKVYDRDLDLEVALKIILPQYLGGPENLLELRKNIRRVRKLNHPNIVRIHDEGVDGDIFFFTMQHLEGLTLRKIIDLRKDKQQVFQLEEIAPILSQIGQALEYAHASIFHGYLKPQNVIVLPDLLKVTDFGLALSLPFSSLQDAHQSHPDGILYLAPEMHAGHIGDSRSDIFSLGVLLAEMLTGQILERQIESLRLYNPECHHLLDAVYHKATETSPTQRYQHVADFVADLNSILEFGELAESEEVPTVISQAEHLPYQLSEEPDGNLSFQEMTLDEDKALENAFSELGAPTKEPAVAKAVSAEHGAAALLEKAERAQQSGSLTPPPLPLPSSQPNLTPPPLPRAASPKATGASVRFDDDGETLSLEDELKAASPPPLPPKQRATASPPPLPKQEPAKRPTPASPLAPPAPFATPGSAAIAPPPLNNDIAGSPLAPPAKPTIPPPSIPHPSLRPSSSPAIPNRRDNQEKFSRTGLISFFVGMFVIFTIGGVGIYLKFVHFPRQRAKEFERKRLLAMKQVAPRNIGAPITMQPPTANDAGANDAGGGDAGGSPIDLMAPERTQPDAGTPEKATVPPPVRPTERRATVARPNPRPSVRRTAPVERRVAVAPPKRRSGGSDEPPLPNLFEPRRTEPPSRREIDKKRRAAILAKLPEIPRLQVSRCPSGMAHIRSGSFRMGSSPSDEMRSFGELPLVLKSTKDYCIDRYEYPGRGRRPKTSVSWNTANNICQGMGKRLCTEVEWERACKGGRNIRYPYGSNFSADSCNTRTSDGKDRSLRSSGSFRRCKSAYGVYDMSGNAAEWTSSRFRNRSWRIIRGGAANRPDWDVRCASRGNLPPTTQKPTIGFRCCADPR